MNQNISHRNHYIPQFYLKNWSLDGRTIQTYSILVSNENVPYWTKQSIKNTAVWNQYSTEVFLKKYADNVSENSVSIEQHANEHYKVWCIKGVCISLQLWSELVNCTLDEPFRRLFAEIIGAEIIEED